MNPKKVLSFCLMLLILVSANAVATVNVLLKSEDHAVSQDVFDVDICLSGLDEVEISQFGMNFDPASVEVTGITSHVDGMILPGQDTISIWNVKGSLSISLFLSDAFIPGFEKKILTISFRAMSESESIAVFELDRRLTYTKKGGFPPEDVTGALIGTIVYITPVPRYEITAFVSPEAGGTISDLGEQVYDAGSSPTYTVIVNDGYAVDQFTVSSDPDAMLDENNEYTFPRIEGNAAIAVSFKHQYRITASATPAEGGSITHPGTLAYDAGTSVKYSVTVNEGYALEQFVVSSDPDAILDENNEYTFPAITEDASVAATFKRQYKITASATPEQGGSISDPGEKIYDAGTRVTYKVSINEAYLIDKLTVSSDSSAKLDANNEYVFDDLGADARIDVVFRKIIQHTISASANPAEGGSIEPSGFVSVDDVTDQLFSITANEGWKVDKVLVDGDTASLTEGDHFLFSQVEADHSIVVLFKKVHTINAVSVPEEGGTIDPSGSVRVEDGGDQIFAIVPNDGWVIDAFEIDGDSAELIENTYAFENMSSDHQLTATFKKLHGIHASVSPDAGGEIEPSGSLTVTDGDDQQFLVTPYDGWEVLHVLVNGKSVETESAELRGHDAYTLRDIHSDSAIIVMFREKVRHTITATAQPAKGGSISPSGSVLVDHGGKHTFFVEVRRGWEAETVVDGNTVELSADGTYAFGQVDADHDILVTFSGTSPYHSADLNMDFRIDLDEVNRILELYEAGSYHCDASGADGFAPNPDGQNCPPHDSDYTNLETGSDQNWRIELSELLRVIQLYHGADGYYHPDPAGEDGFVPGREDWQKGSSETRSFLTANEHE